MSWARVTCQGADLGDPCLEGVTLEMVGRLVPSAEARDSSWPMWWELAGFSHCIKIQRMIVRSATTPVYGDIRWRPNGDRKEWIGGHEHPPTREEAECVSQWINAAVRAVPRRRGPKNSRYFTGGRPEFEATLVVAMRHVHRHDPPITKTKVARAFSFTPKGLNTSYRQLQTWLKKFNVDFDALRLAIEP
jgi:hypothetical protein